MDDELVAPPDPTEPAAGHAVSVSINGESVVIERDAWGVLMRAVNLLVDSGDITAYAEISNGLLARAKMASGALYLLAHRR